MRYFQSREYPVEAVLSEHMEKQFGTHNHVGHYVISLLLSGKAKVEMAGKEREYGVGEVFLAAPFVPHALWQYADTRMLSICIGVDLVERYSLRETEEILQEFLRKVEKEQRQENQAEKEGLNIILAERITAAIKQVYELHEKAGRGFDKEIAVLTEKMVMYSECEMQMEDWEKTAFMSRYYLIRKFKSALGMTPHQFQMQNRVRRAQRLLNDGEKVSWVSAETGFYDQSHLVKCFRKIVGISPTEYKNSTVEFR